MNNFLKFPFQREEGIVVCVKYTYFSPEGSYLKICCSSRSWWNNWPNNGLFWPILTGVILNYISNTPQTLNEPQSSVVNKGITGARQARKELNHNPLFSRQKYSSSSGGKIPWSWVILVNMCHPNPALQHVSPVSLHDFSISPTVSRPWSSRPYNTMLRYSQWITVNGEVVKTCCRFLKELLPKCHVA